MENKMSFVDIFLSWGFSILVLIGVILSFIALVNGHVDGFKDFITDLLSNLVAAVVYLVMRMVPGIDSRVIFYTKK